MLCGPALRVRHMQGHWGFLPKCRHETMQNHTSFASTLGIIQIRVTWIKCDLACDDLVCNGRLGINQTFIRTAACIREILGGLRPLDTISEPHRLEYLSVCNC